MPAASCRALLAASPPPEPATVPCRPLPATRAGRGATGRAAACGDREQEDEKREREQSRKVERAGEEIFSNFYSTVRQSLM